MFSLFTILLVSSDLSYLWKQLAGKNSHHIIEATFKAFARALRQATESDPRRLGSVPRSVLIFLGLVTAPTIDLSICSCGKCEKE